MPKTDPYKVDIRKPDGTIDFAKAAALKQQVDAERAHNFATVDPKTCTHSLVYCKVDDDMHCHFCDRYMYSERHNDE